MKKKIFIPALIILLIIVLGLMWFFMSKNGSKAPILPSITPYKQQYLGPSSVGGAEPAKTPQEKEAAKRSALVTQLINFLPYSGADFSFFYSFTTNEFTLYIPFPNQQAGNAEFDFFLKQHGVDSRSWIPNLIITNQQITPAP